MLLQDIIENYVDEDEFQAASTAYLVEHHPNLLIHWTLFTDDLNNMPGHEKITIDRTEKLWLLRIVLLCLINKPDEAHQLAQLSRLTLYLKAQFGEKLVQDLLGRELESSEYSAQKFITACQLLMDLADQPSIISEVPKCMPSLSKLVLYLKDQHALYLAKKYPTRSVDEIIAKFSQQDDIVKFPLSPEDLASIKVDYINILQHQSSLYELSLEALKTNAKSCTTTWREHRDRAARQHLIAIILELIRRFYKISVYDTQILSFLALLQDTGEGFKGRIAQIKTGEGKSTIIAMLAVFMGCQGEFVDVITSSEYLAKRDCEKYTPFFEALGLTASHICDANTQQSHFYGQILFGISTDFEFALLRDGLHQTQLRKSMRDGKLQDRTFDVSINDEIDSLFLDMARNSALLSLPSDVDISWIYEVIYNFSIQDEVKIMEPSQQVKHLRLALMTFMDGKYADLIPTFSDLRLKHWLQSAYFAMQKKHEGEHYVVKTTEESTAHGKQYVDGIVIMDVKTGRPHEGCQWQHGAHQFLQLKHKLPFTPESFTAASIAHPTFFKLYKQILGLTGTMGEKVERKEIQAIYKVGSFDVPPHLPSLRTRLPSKLTNAMDDHHSEILSTIIAMKKLGRPSLVLFETIKDSERFQTFLIRAGIAHQLINTRQREAEDYLIARAGETGMITIATNAAGRGTDILLSPASKKAGGLHVIFTFYPSDLRVEGQGFGRAGRQGQAGSCNMILNIQEKGISDLLKRVVDPYQALLLLSLMAKFKTEKVMPAEPLLEILDTIRRNKIGEESVARRQCSKLESVLFKKLQRFFEKLGRIDQLFKSEAFKSRFIECCVQGDYAVIESGPHLDDKEWKAVLNQYAGQLIEQQLAGNKVDWTFFMKQFSENYLSYVRKSWAMFYNQLHDTIQYTDIETMTRKVDEAYEQSKSQLDSVLSAPETAIFAQLNLILSAAHQDIVKTTTTRLDVDDSSTRVNAFM